MQNKSRSAVLTRHTAKRGTKAEGATKRLSFQRLSFQLQWVRDHREAVISTEETSDSVVKRVIHLFLEKFSTQRSYTLQITETHASMKFNF